MDRKKLLLYSLAGLGAAVAIVLSILSLTGPAPTAAPTPTPLPSASVDGGPVGPLPTPTGTAAPVDLSKGLGPYEHNPAAPALDLTAFRVLAINTVTAYATFNTAESAAERTARIAAAAGAGSPISAQVTGLALARHDETVAWSARTGLVGSPYAAVTSDNGDSFTFGVVTDYWGSYGTPEDQSQQARGTWQVTIALTENADGTVTPGQVTAITEPDFILK